MTNEIKHWSDCATHNEPAYPNGECDCGGYSEDQKIKVGDLVTHVTKELFKKPYTVKKIIKRRGGIYAVFEEGGLWELDRLLKVSLNVQGEK